MARLAPEHDVSRFDCGKSSLNHWLQKYALSNQRLDSSKTYVTCPADDPTRVVGYYSLTVSSVQHFDAPAETREGMPRYPIPVMLLGRMGVDQEFRSPNRKTRLGSALLKDALLRSVRVAEEVGLRAMVVDALDEDARGFYERFQFEQSPTNELQLFLSMNRIRASLLAAGVPMSDMKRGLGS